MSENLVGEKLGNYRLERVIGRGRMGIVYLARDEALLRYTAVKLLCWTLTDVSGINPETWFISEARNAARINHPNVVQIYGVARHGPYCYIAMEYVEGASADIWVSKHGTLGLRRATELLAQAADALHAAHAANVIHRDVKPENLLLRHDGTIKLGDFGMAMDVARERQGSADRAGTPYYTAPEIWRGGRASVASDIYALGATYYYLLMARPPYMAHDLKELVDAHLHAPIPDVPAGVGGSHAGCQLLVQRCLAKNPRQRYSNAAALAFDARALIAELDSGQGSLQPSTGAEATGGHPDSGVESRGSRAMPPGSGNSWETFFGFVHEPFDLEGSASRPYSGEPLASARQRLGQLIAEESCRVIVVSGAPGSGKSALIGDVAASEAVHTRILRFSLAETRSVGALPAVVARVVAEVAARRTLSGLDGSVDGIGGPSDSLVVIDDCTEGPEATECLTGVVRLALASPAFRLVLVMTPQCEQALALAWRGPQKWETLALRALTFGEAVEYVKAWMAECLGDRSGSVVWTPDALLLLWHQSRGNLLAMDRVARAILRSLSIRRKRSIDSWEIWSAQDVASGASAGDKPSPWPPAEILELLNSLRQRVGLPQRKANESRESSEQLPRR